MSARTWRYARLRQLQDEEAQMEIHDSRAERVTFGQTSEELGPALLLGFPDLITTIAH